ncbi:hypothetical protein VOI54_13290 [Tamlana sp. 2201CG12-4]|uniref:hypothetical protein n=1 Tax=Tamlana sp. 2201CG12-4 TaxID=3112582 RepID=UPI002DBE446B|nr:hypothetical protein [Tamlana sp. 2201CG12-4]MEC3907999.1 hypothetical protein [Tamlana sp. 2201CG12-4]
MIKPIFYILFTCIYGGLYAQVGIGTPLPDNSAQLDIVANDKGLLIPRINLQSSTDATTIINGNVVSLLIYNTTNINDVTPGYYYWNGSKWTKLLTEDDDSLTQSQSNVITNTGTPIENGLINSNTGNIYIDKDTGNIFIFNGSLWVNITKASNGLTYTNTNGAQLGGTLVSPTVIQTNNSNTLAITGLEEDNNPLNIMAIDKNTGVLKKTNVSSLLKREDILIVANNMQTQFITPLPISDSKKIDIYRNGIKISFVPLSANTIELETGVVCFKDDEIRIVQYY